MKYQTSTSIIIVLASIGCTLLVATVIDMRADVSSDLAVKDAPVFYRNGKQVEIKLPATNEETGHGAAESSQTDSESDENAINIDSIGESIEPEETRKIEEIEDKGSADAGHRTPDVGANDEIEEIKDYEDVASSGSSAPSADYSSDSTVPSVAFSLISLPMILSAAGVTLAILALVILIVFRRKKTRLQDALAEKDITATPPDQSLENTSERYEKAVTRMQEEPAVETKDGGEIRKEVLAETTQAIAKEAMMEMEKEETN